MEKILIADTCFYEDDPGTPNRHIDYVKMKSAGVKGVIIRAGQRAWIDSSFYRSWTDTKAAGLPRGSYWFYDSRATPQSQAFLWYETLRSTGDFGELPLMADYEEDYGGDYTGGHNFKIFIEELQRFMPKQEIMIYTGYWYWKDYMPSSLHEFFSQFGCWLAAYNNVGPQVPPPWKRWDFWQFTDKGNGDTYGTEGNVDLNYYNGTLEEFKARFKLSDNPEPPKPDDEIIKTHTGVTLYKLKRFGTNVWMHVIDPLVAKIEISDCGFRKPSYARDFYKAQIVSNGGGWPNVQDANHRANEMWVRNGRFMQTVSYIKDNRPYINFSPKGLITVAPNAQVIQDIYNAVGFDRLVVINGKFNTAVSDRTTKDARTGSGVTADNKYLLLSCEGNDYKSWGLTLEEMAKVFIEFGAVSAGNNDGGSSTGVINTAISNDPLFKGSDGVEAPVINHILVHATPLIEPEIPEEPEEDMNYEVVMSARFRSTPTTSTNEPFNPSSVVGTKFESTIVQQDIKNPAITMVKHPNGMWLPLSIGSAVYTKLIVPPGPEPEPVEDPIVSVITITASGVRQSWVPLK